MIKPTIHLNGSSAQGLVDDYTAALDALRSAVKLLEACGPNGRDYYPQGMNVIHTAQEEHCDRIRSVERVRMEIEEIRNHIVEIAGERIRL